MTPISIQRQDNAITGRRRYVVRIGKVAVIHRRKPFGCHFYSWAVGLMSNSYVESFTVQVGKHFWVVYRLRAEDV